MRVFLKKGNSERTELDIRDYTRVEFDTGEGVFLVQLGRVDNKFRVGTDGRIVINPITCNAILLHHEGYW